ncbi:nucleolar GTP-binding protein 1 [Protomyces lactucae-debilis]|uniref:Nucleolar GTP-binding protein 1 n=1 Tax=Protomyces lactucae-debilis TaxID=2754530 RepID=A0A1Y2FFB7_PROLT|nr:nucleolar GTP-binding protein 1 [Protomyces lactucae-debilis]ORY82619.1 nucleolar GTP-binding protein 1 [Protomyces lactucae-debilis]
MSATGFKAIQPIPNVGDFLDIVLSRTQRKTPTVIRSGFKISRIRDFYARKIKFTQDTFSEKLTSILDEFPKLNDIHPFHQDLLNVLYDRDHLKIALSQLSTAKHLIEQVARDYVRLIKYGDSLYRCKQLKRAALGRMATILRGRAKDSLVYLEQVRQHLGRLPAIDTNTRTLILCGYPNVGKSSFINKITRADVDVQPYAFTTKSLFVGHMDYKYLRWQVIDTPGILDHPLEEMNTIEMQSITALAHLRACILYFMDLSEQCGYSVAAQIQLFNSIKPLFANKPVLLVVNKIDVMRPEDLDAANAALLQGVLDTGVQMVTSSCFNDQGIMDVRAAACDKLLAARVESKLKGSKINDVLNRIHLSTPQARDDTPRLPHIPTGASITQRYDWQDPDRRKLERDIEAEHGGAGLYNIDLKKKWDLENDAWKADIMPELLDGKNIHDYIDPDIASKLQALEEEEERLEEEGFYNSQDEMEDEGDTAILAKAALIREKNLRLKRLARSKKILKNRPQLPRTAGLQKFSDMKTSMQANKLDTTAIETRARSRRPEASRERGQDVVLRAQSSSRAPSQLPKRDRSEGGLSTVGERTRAEKVQRLQQRERNRMARASESDRHIADTKPKHLFAGKSGIGSARSR